MNSSFYTLYIVNKAGGLIFNRVRVSLARGGAPLAPAPPRRPLTRAAALFLAQDLSPVAKLATNDYLTNASTFHSLHAISRQVAPVASGGLQTIDAHAYSLYVRGPPRAPRRAAPARRPATRAATSFFFRAPPRRSASSRRRRSNFS